MRCHDDPTRGADDRNRTRNLLFTKQLLCRLSYVGLGAAAIYTATAPEHSKGRAVAPSLPKMAERQAPAAFK